jgi:hypothetical protein
MFPWRIVTACFLLSCVSSLSQACSCAGFGPACREMVSPGVAAVFVGTVSSITEARPLPNSDGRDSKSPALGEMLDVSLAVEKSFKGVTSKEVVITTAQGESACGFQFVKGQQYLVYATEHQGKLYTSICQRTMPEQFAGKDLEYLRAFENAPLTGSIFGTYKKYTYDPNFVPKFTPSIMDHYRPPEEDYRAMAPMTGESVTLTGKDGDLRQTKVDVEGKFLFSDLPPGKYSIETSVPPGLSPPFGFASGLGFPLNGLEVLSKGCVEVTFRTEPDGHISGKIFNQDGLPLPNVQVIAWKVGDEFNFYEGSRVYDEKDGSYDIGPLPPGEYILGAYVWVLAQGFPSTADDRNRLTEATLQFFPSGTSHLSAGKIKVVFGEHVTNIDFHLSFDPAKWKNVKTAH